MWQSVPLTGLSKLGSVCWCKVSGCMVCHMHGQGHTMAVCAVSVAFCDRQCWSVLLGLTVQGQQQQHRFLPGHTQAHATTQLQYRSLMPLLTPCKSKLLPCALVGPRTGHNTAATLCTQPLACCPECC